MNVSPFALSDQERQKKTSPVAEDGPIRKVLFNSSLHTIVTFGERSIKVWDANLGCLTKSFKVTNSDISCACFDDRQMRMWVGEANGRCSLYSCCQTGHKMLTIEPQANSPVVAVRCVGVRLFVAYADGKMCVFDEIGPCSFSLARSFNEGFDTSNDLAQVSVHSAGLIATSSVSELCVKVWGLETGRIDFVLEISFEVCFLMFVGDYPLLAVCTTDSNIRLWNTQCSEIVGEFLNELPDDSLYSGLLGAALGSLLDSHSCASYAHADDWAPAPKKYGAPVSCGVFDPSEEAIYFGDEAGHCRKWGLKRFLQKLTDFQKLSSPELGGIRSKKSKPFHGQGPHLESVLNAPDFMWGHEFAHKGMVTSIELLAGRCVLTASVDGTCRLFDGGCGESQGSLVQSADSHTKSASWDPNKVLPDFRMEMQTRFDTPATPIFKSEAHAAKSESRIFENKMQRAARQSEVSAVQKKVPAAQP